jgi:hypothetical protein
MLNEETREKAEKVRRRRLFQEALRKKRLLEGDHEQRQNLPSFAQVDGMGMIQCRICGEESVDLFVFKKHLTRRQHLGKLEELKKQVGMTEEKEVKLIKQVIEDDEVELGKREEPEDAKDSEAVMQEENFDERNTVNLPAGFFDDKMERVKFDREQKKKVQKLRQQAGLEKTKIGVGERKLMSDLMRDVQKIQGFDVEEAPKEVEDNQELNLGRQFINKDEDFKVNRLKEKLEKYKKMRELKKKSRGK